MKYLDLKIDNHYPMTPFDFKMTRFQSVRILNHALSHLRNGFHKNSINKCSVDDSLKKVEKIECYL